MLTANEQILKTQIEQLQSMMEQMTMYTTTLRQAIVDSSAGGVQTCSEQFYCADQYEVYLPFVCSSITCTVNVYEDIGNGNYRQIHPAISFTGSSVQLRFDSPKSGFIVCTDDGVSSAMHVPQSPMYINPGVALVEEETIIDSPSMNLHEDEMPEITNPQPINVTMPVGSEDISENNFAKAMKGISTWP